MQRDQADILAGLPLAISLHSPFGNPRPCVEVYGNGTRT